MMRRLIAGLVVLGLVLAGCSTDPTTTEEYQDLEQQLVDIEQRLAETNQQLVDIEERLAETNQPTFGLAPGTITVSLTDLKVGGLAVASWVLPLEPSYEKQALGGTVLAGPGLDVMHPQGDRYFDVVRDEVAMFEPGTYRFIIEAYVPSGPMHYGCEQLIEVVEGEPLVVTISDMPAYTGGGFHWTTDEQLQYPDCL
jgi:hypothetical protein